MKILLKILSVFLYFNSVTAAMMYYIYDDNPLAGYVAGEFTKSGYETRNSYNFKFQKHNNEHVVDSHFKVMKSSSHLINTTPVPKPVIQEAQTIAEEPKKWQSRNMQLENTGTHQDAMNRNKLFRTNNSPLRITNEQTLQAKPNKEYIIQRRPRPRQEIKDNYDNKPVELNVRKTQISTDPQKVVKLNNNRQITAVSIPGPEDNFQRVPTSLIVDSKLKKSDGQTHPYSEKKSQMMSRILDDMTQKVTDRRNKKGEYRKRDTDGVQADFVEKSKRNNISDNMKKYIGKEKSVKDRKGGFEMARIGSLERSVEARYTPYALFYRMNPESLDQQDGFYLINSMEESSKNMFSVKDKRFPINYDSELDLKVSKMNTNTVKLHKKVKNYNNFKEITIQ